MSIASRLDRITPDLSARERAVLVLRAVAAGQEPDPELKRFNDRGEQRAFNRYMGLFFVVNSELGTLLQSILSHVQRLEEHVTLEILRDAARLAEQETGERADPKVVKRWRKSKEVNIPELLLGLAEEVRALLLGDVLARWQELRALELAWQGLSSEFEGESLLLPEVGQWTAEARLKLLAQVERLSGPRRLPEPEPDLVEAVQDRVERAMGFLGLYDPSLPSEPEVPRRFRDASAWEARLASMRRPARLV
jgi:hypothetical protein